MDFMNLICFGILIIVILITSKFIETDETNSTSSKSNANGRSFNNYKKNSGFVGEKFVPIHSKNSPETFKLEVSPSHADKVFCDVLDFLKNEVSFRYGKTKKEKDYQDNLFQRLSVLKERYDYKIGYERGNNNHRIDLSVDDVVGVEMKVYRGGANVRKELFNQISDYAGLYKKIIGFILNVTDKDNEEIRNEIKTKLKEQHSIGENDYEIVVVNIGLHKNKEIGWYFDWKEKG